MKFQRLKFTATKTYYGSGVQSAWGYTIRICFGFPYRIPIAEFLFTYFYKKWDNRKNGGICQ